MKQSPAVVSTATVPGSLLSQYKLLRAVIDAPWATRLDHKITSHIIDRYFGKYEVARASLRYLENATGATRTNIGESLRRISSNGVIKISRQGVGTRPTEYGLNFEFPSNTASGPVDGTSTSGPVDGTSRGPADGTSSAPSGPVDGTESYLLNVPTGTLKVSRIEETPAVPTAPPVSSLEAHTAATAVDPEKDATPDSPSRNGFEELWAAFPRKHDRSKAQAAYKKLAPDTDLHETLVVKATALAEHYRQNSTEPKWWKHLHNWLVEERYLEDLPVPYENPKEAAIASARENGPRKEKPQPAAKATGLSPKTPIGRHKVKIIGSEMPDDSGSPEQRFKFVYLIEDGDHEGKEFSHTFKYLSADEHLQIEGQSLFAELRKASGVLEPEDTSDFHDISLRAIVGKMGRIEYAAL